VNVVKSACPGVVYQLFPCILFVLLWFEMVVLILPERWRGNVYELQFGPAWTAKKRGGEAKKKEQSSHTIV